MAGAEVKEGRDITGGLRHRNRREMKTDQTADLGRFISSLGIRL